MLASQIPARIPLPFANGGGKNTIPTASQIGVTPGAASLTDGFPPATRTPLVSGGVPPAGLDMNGILFMITAVQQWQSAGGAFTFDATFSTSIGGYPKGCILMSSAADTEWVNLADNNTTNPDATDGSAANWARLSSYGITAVTGLTNANVTLTPAQYGKGIITLAGTLTGNVQIIFPANKLRWLVVNNTSGAYAVTCKTASGTGALVAQGGIMDFYGDGTNLVPLPYITQSAADSRYLQSSFSHQIQPVTAVMASAAATVGLNPTGISFRSTTLGDGAPNELTVPTAISMVIPSGATLGTVSGIASRIAILAIANVNTVELAVVNLSGGNNLDETNLINTTAISGSSTAANVIYSTVARSNVAYRVVGIFDSTQASAGSWLTTPSLVQGVGGQSLATMAGIGYGQNWVSVNGSRAVGTTYYNTSGKPKLVVITARSSSSVYAVSTVNGVLVAESTGNTTAVIVAPHTFIVPPGGSYVFTGGTFDYWSELG